MTSLKIDLVVADVTLASMVTEAIDWATRARVDHGLNLRVLNLSMECGGPHRCRGDRAGRVPAAIPGRDEIYGGEDDWMGKGNTAISGPGGEILATPSAATRARTSSTSRWTPAKPPATFLREEAEGES